jgi:hypothetical protein
MRLFIISIGKIKDNPNVRYAVHIGQMKNTLKKRSWETEFSRTIRRSRR